MSTKEWGIWIHNIVRYVSNYPDVMQGKISASVIDGLTLDYSYCRNSPQAADYHGVCGVFSLTPVLLPAFF